MPAPVWILVVIGVLLVGYLIFRMLAAHWAAS